MCNLVQCSRTNNSPQMSLEPINTILEGKRVFAGMIKLGNLRWGNHKYPYQSSRQRVAGEEKGNMPTEAVTGAMWPQTKECQQPPDRTDQGWILPWSLQRKCGGISTLILAQWNWFQTYGLQKGERINTCCFKPSSLWEFVRLATKN